MGNEKLNNSSKNRLNQNSHLKDGFNFRFNFICIDCKCQTLAGGRNSKIIDPHNYITQGAHLPELQRAKTYLALLLYTLSIKCQSVLGNI